MGQSTGELIKAEIMKLLNQFGHPTSQENIELIYGEHLNDPQDRPLPKLISINSHKLKRQSEAQSELTVDNIGIKGIKEHTDFWKEAMEFSKELIVPDIEERFIAHIKQKQFNHNEILLFRKMLADAIEYNFTIAQLKYTSQQVTDKQS